MREGKADWEGQTSVWSVAMVASGDVQPAQTCMHALMGPNRE